MKPEQKIADKIESQQTTEVLPHLNMAAAQTIFIQQCQGLCADITKNPKASILELFHKNFPLHVAERSDQIQRFANLFFSDIQQAPHERRKSVEHWLAENNPIILEAINNRLLKLQAKTGANDSVQTKQRKHTP